jgi:hypothetical protein
MTLSRKSTKFQLTATVAILALGISSQASAQAFPSFTVDPNGAFGAVGGPHQGPFQADFITGNSSTLVTTAGSPTAHGAGWVNLSSFVNAGSNVLATTSGLNNSWQMWAEFTYDVSLTGGAYAKPGSTYNVTNLNVAFWADPSIATPTRFTSASNSGEAATVAHGTDAFQFGSADLIVGVANINALGGTSFNSTNNFLLNEVGTSLFPDPAPFHTIQSNEFNNTTQGVFIDPQGRFIALNETSGGVDFNLSPIPEPETYAMLLAGLGLMGFMARRRKAS